MAIDLKRDLSHREAFSSAITKFGKQDERVFTVAADSESRFGAFCKEVPERALNVGIAEQNAVSIAAGLAFCGKVPFVTTYATFMTMRACEQIRTDVAFAKLPVRIVGTNIGFSSDWLGFTHQAFEDVAMMRAIPNLTVLVPADGEETYRLTAALIDYEAPAYMRLRATGAEPHVESADPIEIGKGRKFRSGDDLAILACGRMVHEAITASDRLAKEGIAARVLGFHTIKPLDEEAVLAAAAETKGIITVEEHNVIGGLGSAVTEITAGQKPVYVKRLGIQDRFGIPGPEKELFAHFGLTAEHIINASRELLESEGSK